MANEFSYEKAQVIKLSSPLETIVSVIQNVANRLKYTNQQYKPNVKFEGNTVQFVTNTYQIVDQRTNENLKKQFTNVFKLVLDTAKQDISDAGLDFNFDYKFIKDSLSVQQSRGFGSKSYVAYTQDWELEII